jgi:DNA-directed RNA polymerase specialized sigma24 family protein
MATAVKYINAEKFRKPRTILQRVAGEDKAAIDDCLDAYGDLVWNSVRRFVDSNTQAEIVVQEIFKDIWKFARRYDAAKLSENDFILLLVRQRLRINQIH